MRTTILRGFFLLLALAGAARGANVSSNGFWTEVINASDLVAGAGSDLTSQYENSSGTTTLRIFNTGGISGAWRILARRSDGTWHGNFVLSVRRTTNGNGQGNVTGGTSYIPLTTLDTEIFSGNGNVNNISVQYKLTGMSKNVPPNTYSSSIIFTLLLL